jgi:hypothetical protein
MTSSFQYVDRISIRKEIVCCRIGWYLRHSGTCHDHCWLTVACDCHWENCDDRGLRRSIYAFWLEAEGAAAAVDDVHHMSHNETVARDCRGPGRNFRLRHVVVVRHNLHNRFCAEILQDVIDPLNDPLIDPRDCRSLVRHDDPCALRCSSVSIVETPLAQEKDFLTSYQDLHFGFGVLYSRLVKLETPWVAV